MFPAVAARCKESTFPAGVLALLVCLFAFAEPIAAQTVALTGTVTDDSEQDIRAGASTIVLTLTGDTWVSGGTFNILRGVALTTRVVDGWTR